MNPVLSDPGLWSRIQFGFTVTYHYLFPQLTMWPIAAVLTVSYAVFVSRQYTGKVSLRGDTDGYG
jgi:cytochrome bd-type quinol oxidase subunit 1